MKALMSQEFGFILSRQGRQWASPVAQMIKNPPAMQETWVQLGRSPGGGQGNPLQYSCLENPHGPRSLASYNPWGCKELNTTD